MHAPQSSEDRQEVVLYHLMHPPFQVFLLWSSYEGMVSEIANHYSRDRREVVDAYEVVANVRGLSVNVVPIVVHLAGDVLVGQTVILVLCDTEFHAHPSQHNFQTGPDLSRQVMRVPNPLARHTLLQLANVQRHCQNEQGRCIVFHNNVRWPDHEEGPRVVAHGDYLRIAVPPSDSIPCDTLSLVEMRQRGLTEDEILQQVFEDEVASGYSPSMLDDAEVGALATDQIEDLDDAFDAMQVTTRMHSFQFHRSGRMPPPKTQPGMKVFSTHDMSECGEMPSTPDPPRPDLESQPVNSLTDEILQYVDAVNNAGIQTNVLDAQDEVMLTQPHWVQDIWEKWISTETANAGDQQQ